MSYGVTLCYYCQSITLVSDVLVVEYLTLSNGGCGTPRTQRFPPEIDLELHIAPSVDFYAG